MPSIIDPAIQIGGAWTVTRSILGLLRDGPLKAEVEVVALPKRSRVAHRFRQGIAVGRSLVSGLPSKIEFARSRDLLARVLELCQQRFDLILVNGTDLAWLLPHLPGEMKRALIAHNIEHQLFATQIRESQDGGVVGRLQHRDLQKLRTFEVESLSRARNVIFLSSLDAEYAREYCPGVRSIIVPPVFENAPIPRSPRARTTDALHLGMLANFGWWPNREGLAWFIEKVFPYISPRIHLHVFGTLSERAVPIHPRIRAHGYTARLSEVWDTCDIMISPVISGGGVCVKVAEAIYHGMPLLASRFSVRGLPLELDPSIVLVDRAEDWIEFLDSGADALAERTAPRSIADRFRADAHWQSVSEFLTHSL